MLNLFRSNLHNKSLIMCCRLSYGVKLYRAMYIYLLSSLYVLCVNVCAQCNMKFNIALLKRDFILMAALFAQLHFITRAKRCRNGGGPTGLKVIDASAAKKHVVTCFVEPK
jgi:hypothetical protein